MAVADSDSSTVTSPTEPSPIPLVFIGTLWVLLALAISVYQLARPAQIEIEWITETEFDTAGFNIYRADTGNGQYNRLNERIIDSIADPASGATYTYVDDSITPGETYFYVLEDIDLSGQLIRHEDDVIQGEFVRFEWWALIAVPISLLVGILLLFTGISRLRTLRSANSLTPQY